MTGELSIHRAGPQDQARWDAFANAHGSFFHRYGWAACITQTYGHQTPYLYAEESGQIVGILPLVDRRSVFFGRALISTAFTVGGGVAATHPHAQQALLAAAAAEMADRNAEYVELRSHDQQADGWAEKHGIYDNFSFAPDPDPDLRLKAIPRKKRADLRKAIKRADAGDIQAVIMPDTDLFWAHYARAQRDHGTPIFPKRWLTAQADAFGDDMETTLITAGDDVLAGVVSYYHGDRVLLYNAFIGEKARAYHAGDYLYWWMMGRGLERGARIFDLGRSKRGTGSHAYKTYWGLEPEPMVYLYKLPQGQDMPNVNPQNPKFALMTQGWRRLPMGVANRLGPLLAGHLA